MNRREHRIYQYLSEPVRLMGFTVDESLLLITGLFGCLFTDGFWFKTGFGMGGMGGVFVLKRLKKLSSGFSLVSFVHWYVGIFVGRSSSCPPSHKRFWLS